MAVTEEFKKLIQDPELAYAVAAIKALTLVIKASEGAMIHTCAHIHNIYAHATQHTRALATMFTAPQLVIVHVVIV